MPIGRMGKEAEEEAWAEDGLTVVGVEDRLEDLFVWASEPAPREVWVPVCGRE